MNHAFATDLAAANPPLKVVAMGGGTGLSTLLEGLKRYSPLWMALRNEPVPVGVPLLDITAVVTVTDDGGSSGRLRKEFEVLPPGDIRNCMVALSEDEALLARLFQYRFTTGAGLRGHSFGNLFLTALTHVTGDFVEAVKAASDVLAIAGRIYPSTSANIVLQATLSNGATVTGETRISKARSRIRKIALQPANCHPLPETLAALEDADLITIGPGSLFTSQIPNLLVHGIPDALRRSPALKACFLNLMWQPRETLRFSAFDHIQALLDHAGGNFLDVVVVNSRPIPEDILHVYTSRQARPVALDLDRIAALGIEILSRDLLQDGPKIRHSPAAIAGVAVELAQEGRRRKQRSLPARLIPTGSQAILGE